MCSHVECPTAHDRALGAPAPRCLWAQKKALRSKGTSWEWWLCWQRLTWHFLGWQRMMAVEGTGQAATRCADAGQAPLHRLSPRTMLNVLLLCCGLLQGIQAVLDLRTADLSCGHVQKASGGLERVDRARQASLQRKGKEASAEPAGPLPRLGFEQMALGVQEADGDLVQRGSLLEPQASSTELQAEGREERSPRRCVRLLESCLGHQIPCCDPCATCYCRFFNAFCYCRKISTTFPCGKN
ncbi:agouti-related protein [Melospiza melodia melodia]|uniref:agouti-related protein n=1 Tax=Melospiza melodia melodia TaxID=1914991 RepID=UPI002FCF9084